jgi:ribosomal protein S6--L-glutamate ligase
LQLLARRGIGLPVTAFAHDPEAARELIDICGGAPLIIKLLEGTQGVGVVLAETEKAAESVIEAFRGLDAHILAQEFIAESGGSDLRAFVVGDEVVAAMKRQAAKGEFRANLHRGAKAEAVELSDQERRMALRATKALGLNVAGVDLIRSNDGPLVIEVNASPGLEGIQTATGVDVAMKIITLIEENAGKGPDATRGRG